MKAKNHVQPTPRSSRSLPTLALGLVLSSAVAGTGAIAGV
jgi:hypothetical protein